MDSKLLLVVIVVALVGIAFYTRSKKAHRVEPEARSHAQPTKTPSGPEPKQDKQACDYRCISAWSSCSTRCGMDEACSARCDRTKESCNAACR
ncbi:MAG: hypothetical protein KF819_02385 [Labilithrix sp.]|nr:hypothetical protein [Labilithrix sp.]